jgi:hypothetical protein
LLDADEHALTVDILYLETTQLSAAHASRIKRISMARWYGLLAESMSRTASSCVRIIGRRRGACG